MGTRGLYGLRKDGIDKVTYNHWDSYPDVLGFNVSEFCANTSFENLVKIYNNIYLVNEGSTPTSEQRDWCVQCGLYNENVSTRSEEDWYCLLRNIQGDLERLKELALNGKAYMIDNQSFIRDSLFCEYAYIINLDTKMLEFWTGFQKTPQEGNRYGRTDAQGYYPCKLTLQIPLDEIKSADDAVKLMNAAENIDKESCDELDTQDLQPIEALLF